MEFSSAWLRMCSSQCNLMQLDICTTGSGKWLLESRILFLISCTNGDDERGREWERKK